jgi:cytochrome P450
MAIHPHVAERLRAEVLQHFGPRAPATFQRIKDLKYSTFPAYKSYKSTAAKRLTVRAVINETLRLFPPVPLNVRESRAPACLLPPLDPSYPDDRRPLYMPGSTTIVYLPLLMQRNKALWGPDADEFNPERWIQPDRVAKFVANPAMFAPFSAGPRIVSFFCCTAGQPS